MAEMNLDYYSGSDAYSDGDVEKRILEDVKKFRSRSLGKDSKGGPETLSDRIVSDAYSREDPEDAFAYLYHLSPVRGNILSWYPFEKSASALEIGAGPGAVTGILCEKLSFVTSVELSRRRSDINLFRHRELDNLKIMVGNLNEMKFPGLFDYVVLNGVFEYAASFTEDEHPYEAFLRKCSGFMKKDGTLLVAIENRLGLKYFAGAPEDHTGNYMEGLKGYRKGSGVRTFSKAEWRKLAKSCGMKVTKVFYPYPDYKFPNEVFTDETLSADSMDRSNWNFNERRLELFCESDMARALQEEGVLGSFMNSFLIELKADGPDASSLQGDRRAVSTGQESPSVIYAKMNTDRGEDFRIQTIIRRRKDGGKDVVKAPLTEKAKTHLKRMSEHERRAAGGVLKIFGREYRVNYLKGREEDGTLVYPFLSGKNLGKEAAEAADRKDSGRVVQLADALWELLLGGHAGAGEVQNAGASDGAGQGCLCGEKEGDEDFLRVFGPWKEEKAGPMVCPANIDLIFDNLILDKEQVFVIDAEWIFDFKVPARFILWRAVNELYCSHSALETVLPRQKLLERYGISAADAGVYWKWADHFEKDYVKANSLARYARPVRKADLKDIHTFEGRTNLTATLYIDRGQGFSEKESVHCPVTLDQGDHYEASFLVPDPETVKAIRFDPFEGSCGICVLMSPQGQLRPANASLARKKVSADGRSARVCEFLTKDPSYRLAYGSRTPERVFVEGKVKLLSEDWALERAQHLLGKYQRIFRV